VTQYHRSPGSKKISTIWSLGKFNHSSASGTDLSVWRESFTGGQHCDETGAKRQTQVRFLCCPKKIPGTGGDRVAPKAGPLAIQAVEELRLCHYLISICVPALCYQDHSSTSSSPAAASSAGPTAVDTSGAKHALVIRVDAGVQTSALKGQCWLRHEGWWTYEICYGRHVRQFHIKVVKTGKGHKQVLEQEYLLGSANTTQIKPSVTDATGRKSAGIVAPSQIIGGLVVAATDLTEATEAAAVLDEDGIPVNGLYVMMDNPGRTTLRQYLRHGNACRTDMDSADGSGREILNRSTQIQYVCDDDEAAAGIISIAETHTCSYLAIVHLPVLCTHPSFHVPPLPIHELHCKHTNGLTANNPPPVRARTAFYVDCSLQWDCLKHIVCTNQAFEFFHDVSHDWVLVF